MYLLRAVTAESEQCRQWQWLPWVNVMAHKKMSFANMIDSATAPLGLAPPLKDGDDQKQQNNPNQIVVLCSAEPIGARVWIG